MPAIEQQTVAALWNARARLSRAERDLGRFADDHGLVSETLWEKRRRASLSLTELVSGRVLPVYLSGAWKASPSARYQLQIGHRHPLVDHVTIYRRLGSLGPASARNTAFITQPYNHYKPAADDWLEALELRGAWRRQTHHIFRICQLPGVSWLTGLQPYPGASAYLIADPDLYHEAGSADSGAFRLRAAQPCT